MFTYNEGKLRTADVLHPGTSSGNIYPRVATVILQSRIKGILNIWGSVNVLIDENLNDISTAPTRKPSGCEKRPLGDVNVDCVFDIWDPALTMAYSLAKEDGFSTKLGHTLRQRVTDIMARKHL